MSFQWFDPADLGKKASAVSLVIDSEDTTWTRPLGVCGEAVDEAVAWYGPTKTTPAQRSWKSCNPRVKSHVPVKSRLKNTSSVNSCVAFVPDCCNEPGKLLPTKTRDWLLKGPSGSRDYGGPWYFYHILQYLQGICFTQAVKHLRKLQE